MPACPVENISGIKFKGLTTNRSYGKDHGCQIELAQFNELFDIMGSPALVSAQMFA